MLDRDVVAAVGVDQRQPDRVVGPARVEVGEHAPATSRARSPAGSAPGRSTRSSAVRAAAYSACTAGRRSAGQQPGGQVVALAVPGGDRGAVPVGGLELRPAGRVDRRGHRPGDPLGGEPAADQHHRHADPGLHRRPGEHDVLRSAPGQRGRPERAGLAEGVGQGERGARGHALRRPVGRRGQLLDLDRRRSGRSSRAPPGWPAARRGSAGRARAQSRSGLPPLRRSRLGVGATTLSTWPPVGRERPVGDATAC